MKKVLYLSNIEVPYRVRFFNELAKSCDLTVLYERENSSTRNAEWAKSEEIRYRKKYLHGIKIRGEDSISLGIFKEIFADYDSIIVGCYNSPVQMIAILAMRLFHIPYIVNLDGEPFLNEEGLKTSVKCFFLKGAKKYLVAGKKSVESVRRSLGDVDAIPYYFSSLSDQEITDHRMQSQECNRSDFVLVVGQYFDYKGMDVALDAARRDISIRYKFVGMGSRTDKFLADFHGRIPENVEIIPFLQKGELEKKYRKCSMLVLPSRKECWGLVINEAASYGTPIVSTWGSGAAVEFLGDIYPQYLAKVCDAESLYHCISSMRNMDNVDEYEEYLLAVSKEYTIERSLQVHLNALGII